MIVAPGRRRRPYENAVDEEGHRRLLQPQPGTTDRAGDDVAHHQDAKAGDGDAAQRPLNRTRADRARAISDGVAPARPGRRVLHRSIPDRAAARNSRGPQATPRGAPWMA